MSKLNKFFRKYLRNLPATDEENGPSQNEIKQNNVTETAPVCSWNPLNAGNYIFALPTNFGVNSILPNTEINNIQNYSQTNPIPQTLDNFILQKYGGNEHNFV
uniref:Uncharacterized protein n=1 Tax=Meloidogyne hapla TaxID=6305 RepID=A0A1I8BHQ8_MELHA